MNITTERVFREDIQHSPDGWDTMGIFADWLDEQDRESEAFCLRWMRYWKKRPHERLAYLPQGIINPRHNMAGKRVPARYRWGWYPNQPNRIYPLDPKPTSQALLPPLVFAGIRPLTQDHVYFPDFWQAVQSLSKSLSSLKALLIIQ